MRIVPLISLLASEMVFFNQELNYSRKMLSSKFVLAVLVNIEMHGMNQICVQSDKNV
jgi:hypothetical protein